jgi:GNAT superfamily N-acetyltransferase
MAVRLRISPSGARGAHITSMPVKPSEFEILHAIRMKAMKESLCRIGRYDPARSYNRFRSVFSACDTQYIVLNKEKVGFFAVKRTERDMHLEHLYLLPAAQGQGVGSAVLRWVFEEADASTSALHVTALRDSDANQFYKRHGFIFLSETEWDINYVRYPSKNIIEY